MTSFNPEAIEPEIGAGTQVGELARVVGDVRIGAGSEVSDRAALRADEADEGAPIIIGANANIEERVTFHALQGTTITVGDDLDVGDDSVLTLEIPDGTMIPDGAVVTDEESLSTWMTTS